MPRPLKPRTIGVVPEICHFKPRGVPAKKLKTVGITLDEFEAIRLADYEGLSHEEAAVLMNVSRPTFSRLVEKARVKVAGFLVNGSQLVIDGGNIEFDPDRACVRCKENMPEKRMERRKRACGIITGCTEEDAELTDAKV
ncbi:DUF134 domain-containing protein [Geovibrio sp. ADMFC3]